MINQKKRPRMFLNAGPFLSEIGIDLVVLRRLATCEPGTRLFNQ